MIPLHPPPGDTSTERTVQIDGSSDQIEAAKQMVNEVISEVCICIHNTCYSSLFLVRKSNSDCIALFEHISSVYQIVL